MNKTPVSKKPTPWYWLVLQFLMLLFLALHIFNLTIQLISYYEPFEALPEVKYEEALGLFAPVIYGFSATASITVNALEPVFEFIDTLITIVMIYFLALLVWITWYIFKQRLWATIIALIISALWIGDLVRKAFEEQTRFSYLAVLPISILLISLIVLTKVILIRRMKTTI